MRRLLVLLAVVVLLVVGLWLVLRQEEDAAREERAAARIFTLDNREVRALTLLRGDRRWEFRYDDVAARWGMTVPSRDLASGEQLSNLIYLFGQPIVERTIEEPEALASYGLDPPAMTLVVGEGDESVVHLGAATPTGDSLFARVQGRPGVLVLSDYARQSFLGSPDPNRLRESALFDLLKSEIVTIELGGEEGFALERDADGWWLSSPRRLPADDSQVNTLLELLEETAVRAFLDGADPAQRGEPLLDLRLASAGAERRLSFARDETGAVTAVVDGRETVLQIDPGRIESIPTTSGPFTSRRLTKVNRYSVSAFSFEGRDGRWAARREGEAWSGDDGRPVEERRVLGFLARALGAQTEGWRARAGGAAIATLDYTLEDGATGTLTYLDGGGAVWSAVPDVRFDVPGGPPAIPAE